MTRPALESLPAALFHVTPMSRFKPSKSPNRELRYDDDEFSISEAGLMLRTDSSEIPAVYLSSSRSTCEAYAENGHDMEEFDDWILLQIDTRTLDIDAFLGDYHQEYDSAWEDLLALGYSEEQHDANEIPWWDVLACTNQVRYLKDIPAASITPIAVLNNNDWKEYSKSKQKASRAP